MLSIEVIKFCIQTKNCHYHKIHQTQRDQEVQPSLEFRHLTLLSWDPVWMHQHVRKKRGKLSKEGGNNLLYHSFYKHLAAVSFKQRLEIFANFILTLSNFKFYVLVQETWYKKLKAEISFTLNFLMKILFDYECFNE